ncbi:MAG: hypothetical protein QXE64_00730 [Candidatus Pacearchaeota archaeon]
MVKCSRCRKKIDSSFSYCPYCGARQLKGNLLDDIDELTKANEDELFGNIFDKFDKLNFPFGFGKLIKGLTKQIEAEIARLDKEFKLQASNKKREPKTSPNKIAIRITFSDSDTPGIVIDKIEEGTERHIERENVKREGKREIENERKKIKKIREIKGTKIKKLKELAREEAKTRIMRLSDRIIYELELDGVKSLDDIEIRQLENTTEVKAIAKDKIYFKLIPLALPIISYEFKDGKLYIYFKPEI